MKDILKRLLMVILFIPFVLIILLISLSILISFPLAWLLTGKNLDSWWEYIACLTSAIWLEKAIDFFYE